MRVTNDIIRFFSNKEVIMVFAYCLSMPFIPGVSYIAGVHLILLAFVKKNEWYFKSLVYFSLLKHFNPIFSPPSTNLFLLFVIILSVFFIIKILRTSRLMLFVLEKKFYILLSIFFLTSIIESLYPTFSLIRIIIIFIYIFVVFQSIKYIGTLDLLQFIVRLTMMLTIASFPLIFTKVGYLWNTGFFKGVINHSQDFALILLPLLMTYLMAMMSGKLQKSIFHLVIFFAGMIELVLSASRAAVGALLIAFSFYLIFKHRTKIRIQTLIVILFFLFGGVFMGTSYWEQIEPKLSSFMYKYKGIQRDGMSSILLKTRAGLIETSYNNFLENPLTGIGFNVQTYYPDFFIRQHLDKLIKYIPGTDIIYSRPLEKGNLYTAVFEESGIFAGIYFLYLLLYIIWILYHSKLSYTWIPFLAMTFNFMGEASLFSPSGPGNFQILMIASFYIMALQQYTKRKKNV